MITRLGPGDAGPYRALRLEGLALEPAAFAASHADEARRPDGWFADRLCGSTVFAAIDDGRHVGIAGYYLAGTKSAHLGNVFGVWVTPAARRRGHARALMQALVVQARTDALAWLRLHVNAGNAAAVALYEGLGFRTYATERDALRIAGESHDEHLMELRLTA